ncbi:DUF1722 domain-containing protein [Pseudomonas sp. TH41]|uniref:YbgA family protein n=1 Tax=Pseudomonas sp. TH41 TaxID=2796405 RepID=UPI00191387D6|nr:DUF523 and DUF1722 domain-containing protein [Pseudomonas sp. TH41]MBK5356477.1 DUF1722 domain-containing protein [Pseudomonas sp. TH41]
MPHSPEKPKIAISACLMGAEVRYNGGHKASRLCSRLLTKYFDFVPVCPEVAIGQKMAAELADICGYIFMQKSLSCGLDRVKVYSINGAPMDGGGRGLYAQTFCTQHPDLPVEEDGRLNNPVLRENFLTRVFAYSAWQQLRQEGLTRRGLTEFHARYKYLLMAHNPVQYKALGHLLGNMGRADPDEIGPRYFSELMAALKKCATRRTHTNVLQHLSGYFKQVISAEDKQAMQLVIGQYHQGIVPLVVPLTLLKHYLRQHPDPYIAQQVYLQPHPESLSLRNAI